ncbi:MAG: PDZ domain-containing protein [Gemmatimonadales bacterium]
MPGTRGILMAACAAAGIALAPPAVLGQQAPFPAPAPSPAPARAPRAVNARAPRAAAAASAAHSPAAATSASSEAAAEAASEAAPAAQALWNDLQQVEDLSNAIASRQQRQRRRAWLGIGLSCTNCSYHSEGKSLSRWVFNEPPVLYSVDNGSPADRAGLRTGDTLVSVNGQPLTSATGGRVWANLAPGIAIRIAYRRAGRERTTTVRPEEPPAQRDLAAADAAAERESELSRALTGASQRDMQRAQRELARAQDELARSRGKFLSDSSMQRMREYLEQARRALGSSPSPFLAMPAPRSFMPPSVAPAIPSPGVQPVQPTPGVAPVPGVATPPLGWAVAPPGGLRYSGRLGSTVIEARRPGGVDVLETGDSEVVLTGGDLSVRVALEPGAVVRVRPAPFTVGWATARTGAGDVSQGIQGYLVNPRLADALGAQSGVLVLDVASGSHADSLGILPGDVLVSLNDHPVVSITQDGPFSGRYLRTATPRPGAATAVVVRAHVHRTLELRGGRGPRRR